MNRNLSSRVARAGAVLAATCLVASLAACGNSGSTTDGAASTMTAKVDKLAAMVPDSIAKKGTLVVAGATYPPAIIEPANGSDPTGWDVENTRQIAAVLGLKVEFKIIPFDGVITGLAGNRYDAATGEIYVTPERTQSVTFVTNHASTDALLVSANSPIASAEKEDDLCGHTLAAELGSAEAALIHETAKNCAAKGTGQERGFSPVRQGGPGSHRPPDRERRAPENPGQVQRRPGSDQEGRDPACECRMSRGKS